MANRKQTSINDQQDSLYDVCINEEHSTKLLNESLKVRDISIQQSDEDTLLEVIINKKLAWDKHIHKTCNKICKKQTGLLNYWKR